MGWEEIPPELRRAADHRAGARSLLHGHRLLRARQRHLRHRAVPRALPDRVPLHRAAVDHPAVRGRRRRGGTDARHRRLGT